MPQRFRLSAVACLALGFVALPLHADLITNGSFEAPVVTAGSFENFTTGSTGITGWTVVGPEASIVSGTFTQNGIAFPAGTGNQWLDLTGDGSNSDSEGVEQTVATTAGTQYTLSFLVGNVNDPGGIFGTTSTVDVHLGSSSGTLLGAFTNSSTTTGTQVWESFSTTFTASGPSTTLVFLNGDPANDNTNGLDGVTLNASTSTVPEPRSLSLAIAILIVGLGILRRRTAIR